MLMFAVAVVIFRGVLMEIDNDLTADAPLSMALEGAGLGITGFAAMMAFISVIRWVLAYFGEFVADITNWHGTPMRLLRWWFCAPSVLDYIYGIFGAGAIVATPQY
ncbi:hypothetical protein LX16_3062 [Stackebrandtia albiflava]|uniref:Uncharacterized protein n=2 Tax=Stackebrandtia albiflava TaxID=406432 RepID=A0A562V335_9ACTN|nr:hypothetical protein LX16_3062 [Stackebrandtia albiflava]